MPEPGPMIARFWDKVDVRGPDECWLWTASLRGGGYGYFWDGERRRPAHCVAYELCIGPIPEGLQLDHVRARGCRSKACVNPAHLEPVTGRENTLRGDGPTARHARKTLCPAGHEYDSESRGRRVCLTCKREKMRAARAAQRTVA